VFELDTERCVHCVRWLVAVPVDDFPEFDDPAPLVVCEWCDGVPPPNDAMWPGVPEEWLTRPTPPGPTPP
jgi:hypothetical protein